ncbi:HAD family hydrolase [soil metagenome]
MASDPISPGPPGPPGLSESEDLEEDELDDALDEEIPVGNRSGGFAFFDLDGTLLPYDTQLLFANHVLRAEPIRRLYLCWFLPFLPLALFRVLRSREMKRLFLSYLLHMRREALEDYAHEFADSVIPPLVYPEVMAEIGRHRAAGRTLILNTASPGAYAQRIAARLGFDHCIATRLEIEDRMPVIPQIDGANNKRAAKLHAMAHLLPDSFDPDDPVPLPDSHAYTDSIVDLPLLSCAEHKYVVNPGATLAALANDGNWNILTPPSPHCCKVAERLSGFRQALGLLRHREARGARDAGGALGAGDVGR